jgi:hypothetical protein
MQSLPWSANIFRRELTCLAVLPPIGVDAGEGRRLDAPRHARFCSRARWLSERLQLAALSATTGSFKAAR